MLMKMEKYTGNLETTAAAAAAAAAATAAAKDDDDVRWYLQVRLTREQDEDTRKTERQTRRKQGTAAEQEQEWDWERRRQVKDIHRQPGSSGGRQNSPTDGGKSQDWSSTLQHDACVSLHAHVIYLRDCHRFRLNIKCMK